MRLSRRVHDGPPSIHTRPRKEAAEVQIGQVFPPAPGRGGGATRACGCLQCTFHPLPTAFTSGTLSSRQHHTPLDFCSRYPTHLSSQTPTTSYNCTSTLHLHVVPFYSNHLPRDARCAAQTRACSYPSSCTFPPLPPTSPSPCHKDPNGLRHHQSISSHSLSLTYTRSFDQGSLCIPKPSPVDIGTLLINLSHLPLTSSTYNFGTRPVGRPCLRFPSAPPASTLDNRPISPHTYRKVRYLGSSQPRLSPHSVPSTINRQPSRYGTPLPLTAMPRRITHANLITSINRELPVLTIGPDS